MIWVCVCERVDVPVCACGAGQSSDVSRYLIAGTRTGFSLIYLTFTFKFSFPAILNLEY